jgi:hypothetical protein
MPEESNKIPSEFLVPDLSDLIRRGTHFVKRSPPYTQIVECATGRTLALLDNPFKVPTSIIKKVINGVDTWVEEGLLESAIPKPTPEYSPLVVAEICRLVAEGGLITKICGSPGFPSYQEFCMWRKSNSWIHEALEQARLDRAEALRDEALQIADSACDKNDTPAKQLMVETRKWASGIDSPRYKTASKIDVGVSVPTQIIVHTGIDRGDSDKTR